MYLFEIGVTIFLKPTYGLKANGLNAESASKEALSAFKFPVNHPMLPFKIRHNLNQEGYHCKLFPH